MLLFFAVILLLFMSAMKTDKSNCEILIYSPTGEYKLNQDDPFNKNFSNFKFTYIDSLEEGIKRVKLGECCLCVNIDTSVEPTKYTIYYDHSNTASIGIRAAFDNKKGYVAYAEVTKLLEDEYGIKINEEYFNSIEFEPINNQYMTGDKIEFPLIISAAISVIVMFGIAYSLARDNETKVSRNLSFMPINKATYLLSKIIPFVLLGMIEAIVVCSVGGAIFDVNYFNNFGFLILAVFVFVVTVASMGALFGLLKSQISSVFFDVLVILVPLFALSNVFISSLSSFVQILLYLMPITPFVILNNSLIYSGIFNVNCFLILVVEGIVYYILTLCILKRKNA